jgi:hypothetical protein
MHKLSALQRMVRTFTTQTIGGNLSQSGHEKGKELVSCRLIARMPLLQQDRDVLRMI